MKFRTANEIATKLVGGSVPPDELDRLLLELIELMLKRYLTLEIRCEKLTARVKDQEQTMSRMESFAKHWRHQYELALEHMGLEFAPDFINALAEGRVDNAS